LANKETDQVVFTLDNLESFIGSPKIPSDIIYKPGDIPPGVVTGLAWNPLGGSLVWIETVVVGKIQGEKQRLKTTGKLGDVMRESAEIAHTFARKFANNIDPNSDFFQKVINIINNIQSN
jgi:Lon-like ATP-dependent protease